MIYLLYTGIATVRS